MLTWQQSRKKSWSIFGTIWYYVCFRYFNFFKLEPILNEKIVDT